MRSSRASVVLGVVSAVVAATSQGWAASAWTVQHAENPGPVQTVFTSVSTTSSTDAWAVGWYDVRQPIYHRSMIEHYDGSSWKRVKAPNPGEEVELDAVRAMSPTNAWAVGWYYNPTRANVYGLIEHWDGSTWSKLASPNYRGVSNRLHAIGAAGPSSIWAAGEGRANGLIEHWDGTKWSIQPGAPVTGTAVFHGVTAPGVSNAWAVGDVENPTSKSLIEHYANGSWHLITSPDEGDEDVLTAVSSTSATDIWAVGSYLDSGKGYGALIMHYDGANWEIVSSPSPGIGSGLGGVKAISSNDVWAVGSYETKDMNYHILLLHYDGVSWTVQAAPRVSGDPGLSAIGASSSSNLFAVGSHIGKFGRQVTLVIHCC